MPRRASEAFRGGQEIGSPAEAGTLTAGKNHSQGSVDRLDNQLLHPPIQQFTDIQDIFRWTGDLVDPAELFQLLAGGTEYAQDFSLQTQLVNSPGIGVRAVKHLVWGWCNAYRPGGARRHQLIAGSQRLGLVADGRLGVGIKRYIDGDLAKVLSVGIEHLNTPVATVRDVNVVLRVDGNTMRSFELPGSIAGLSPGFDPLAILIYFGDARIDVSVGDIRVAG
jgi:hypothetical protein